MKCIIDSLRSFSGWNKECWCSIILGNVSQLLPSLVCVDCWQCVAFQRDPVNPQLVLNLVQQLFFHLLTFLCEYGVHLWVLSHLVVLHHVSRTLTCHTDVSEPCGVFWGTVWFAASQYADAQRSNVARTKGFYMPALVCTVVGCHDSVQSCHNCMDEDSATAFITL